MTEMRLRFMQAIVRRQAVAAWYNGDAVKLAPHVLFERHGELFVSAVSMNRRRRPDDERR